MTTHAPDRPIARHARENATHELPVDSTTFRAAVARFASGVTVVTTVDQSERPVGFTATAFSSLSLEPPLVLVCLARNAHSSAVFHAATAFAVSILSADQAGVARRLGTSGIDKFAGLPVRRSAPSGMPIIPDAAAHLECRMDDLLEKGDHTILIGEVLAAAGTDRPPLLYFNRRFGTFRADLTDGASPPMKPADAPYRRARMRATIES